jgi:hypothetical protein
MEEITDKITVADIMAMPEGQSLYELLDEMFPYFSSITFFKKCYFSVTVAKGNDSKELEFRDLDLDHKHQFTYDVSGSGAYIEVSFNDVMTLMNRWKRDSRLGQLGIK